MTIASNYPSIRPSLLLDFANTKQLDPRVTFSRASTGAYYDGKTVVKAEENLLRYSQEFDNAPAWSLSRLSVTANAATAPDGTTTAELLTEDTSASNSHRVFHNYATMLVVGQTYTLSVFAKAGTRSQIFIRKVGDNSDTNGSLFDLSTGTVTYIGSGSTGSIVNVGNGWYRCISVCANIVAQTSSGYFGIAVGGNTSYTGDGTSGLYIWGAQLEQRSTVTAYTPTTTAPITNYIPALQTAAAGVARFEHNPVTGESLGLEIEEQRTNLLTYSDQFDNAAWLKSRASVISNTVISPDGSLSGDKLVEDTTASNTHQFYTGVTTTSGSTYTASVYLKQAGRSKAYIQMTGTSGYPGFYVDLAAGTAETQYNSPIAVSVTSVGNGWHRCSITAVTDATTTYLRIYTALSDSPTGNSYTGDGYSGIYIWGAQLEAGSFATSYIPTVASQVTRSADSASMTGSNFSSWYRADEGTVYSEAVSYAPSVDRKLYEISAADYQNRIFAYIQSNNGLQTNVVSGNTAQAQIYPAGTYTAWAVVKLSQSYKTNDFASVANGGTAVTDASGVLPAVDRLTLGGSVGGSPVLNGTIKRIAYYPKRLSNTELQGITS